MELNIAQSTKKTKTQSSFGIIEWSSLRAGQMLPFLGVRLFLLRRLKISGIIRKLPFQTSLYLVREVTRDTMLALLEFTLVWNTISGRCNNPWTQNIIEVSFLPILLKPSIFPLSHSVEQTQRL